MQHCLDQQGAKMKYTDRSPSECANFYADKCMVLHKRCTLPSISAVYLTVCAYIHSIACPCHMVAMHAMVSHQQGSTSAVQIH